MKKIRARDMIASNGTENEPVEYNKGLIVTRTYPLIDFIAPNQKKVKARVPEINIIKPDKKYPVQITASYIVVTKPSQVYSFLFMPTLGPGYLDKDLFFIFENSFIVNNPDILLDEPLDFVVIKEDLTERYGKTFDKLPNSGVSCRDLTYNCVAGELEEMINLFCQNIPCNKYNIESSGNKEYHFKATHGPIAEFSRKITEIF